MKINKITLMIILYSVLNCIYAYDPSSPKDGNLLARKTFEFNTAEKLIFNDDINIILNKNNIYYINNRITLGNDEAVPDFSSIADLNRNSDAAFTPEGYYVVLTGNSRRYDHGILGDDIEATGFAVIFKNKVLFKYKLKDNQVFETLRPLIADIAPENQGSEILLTVSDSNNGSRIDVFSLKGRFLGSSPAIGQGYRWMHLLAAGSFGPEGQMEVAAVKTPHIGGVLELYRWDGKSLVKNAFIAGVSTHRIGSDNLNMALAADFDGQTGFEIILPSDDYKSLKIIKHTQEDLIILQTIQLPGRLDTNLLLLTGSAGSFWLGTDDGSLIQFKN